MTFLKRFFTAVGIFFPLLIILYIGICAVGGGVAGGRAAIEHPDVVDKQELGREAGRNFVKNNIKAIALTSLGGSFVISVAISFSGILPWCKKPSGPPPLS